MPEIQEITIGDVGVIVAVIFSMISIIKMWRDRNKEFATKEFVGQEVELVDIREEFKEFKKDHAKQHADERLINSEFRTWLKEEITEVRKDIRSLK